MGSYIILRVCNHDHIDEHTNVGAAIYDDSGKQVGIKADGPERAIARGDLKADWGFTKEQFERRLTNEDTLETVKRSLESMGHAMSCIQISEPRWTRASDEKALLSIFDSFVLGKSGMGASAPPEKSI